MADHPLRPASHRRLGRPLPYQLPNGTQSSPPAHIAFIGFSCEIPIISGISCRFQQLSRSEGQVLYALLTRPPPYYHPKVNSSRLACVKHSVSVHPEPGSNSSFKYILKHFRVYTPNYWLRIDYYNQLRLFDLSSLFNC